MLDEDNYYEGDDDIKSLIERFESMRREGVYSYLDVDDYIRLIEYYMAGDRPEGALSVCVAAEKVHGKVPEIQLRNAKILRYQGKFAESYELLQSIDMVIRDNFEYWLVLAALNFALKKEFDPKECFDRVVKLSKTQIEPEAREEVFSDIGVLLEHENNYELALYYYKKAIKDMPNAIEFYFRAGVCYENMGYRDEGIACYTKAIDIDPLSELAWYNYGVACSHSGMYEKAIEAYDYAIALDPIFYDAIFNKGNCYGYMGNFADAMACYQEYLDIFPDSFSAQCYIGECHLRLGDTAKALEYFDNVLKRDKSCGEAWYGKAMVYDTMNKPKEAISSLRRAVQSNPEDEASWYHLGRILSDMERYWESIAAYERAIELNKYKYVYWLLLAMDYFKIDFNYKQSIEIVKQGLEYLPDHTIMLFALSGMYCVEGNEDECRKNFLKAYNTEPELYEYFLNIAPLTRAPAEVKVLIGRQRRKKK